MRVSMLRALHMWIYNVTYIDCDDNDNDLKIFIYYAYYINIHVILAAAVSSFSPSWRLMRLKSKVKRQQKSKPQQWLCDNSRYWYAYSCFYMYMCVSGTDTRNDGHTRCEQSQVSYINIYIWINRSWSPRATSWNVQLHESGTYM